ncbi:MAG: nuclear transport factor 2 family protein [Acidimicrobiia bacterium]
MNKRYGLLTALLPSFLVFVACTSPRPAPQDLVNDPFPEAQAELREVVTSIVKDAMTANIEGLQAAHLVSDKFTKFGPRSFDRQDVASTNESEAAFFGSISNFKQEIKDLKIDIFGDIGIATYYPHVSFVQVGEEKTGSGRQTLVFLKTENGWKIVHEHGTPKF